LKIEETFIEEGREEGILHGSRLGRKEGIELGYKTGFELGNELGYYRGCVEGWLLLSAKFPNKFSERSKKTLLSLKDMIDSLDLDPTREAMTDEVQKIRDKFKVMTSQVGFTQKYLEKPNEEETTLDINFLNCFSILINIITRVFSLFTDNFTEKRQLVLTIIPIITTLGNYNLELLKLKLKL